MIDYHEAADELVHVVNSVNKLKSFKQFYEYTRGEMSVLSYLRHHQQETIVPSEIGDFCHISSARVAAVLNKLEDKGYISREIDKKDRRRILVYLTEKGRERSVEAKEEGIALLVKVLAEMGEEDTTEFLRTWQSFIAASQKINLEMEKDKKEEE